MLENSPKFVNTVLAGNMFYTYVIRKLISLSWLTARNQATCKYIDGLKHNAQTGVPNAIAINILSNLVMKTNHRLSLLRVANKKMSGPQS